MNNLSPRGVTKRSKKNRSRSPSPLARLTATKTTIDVVITPPASAPPVQAADSFFTSEADSSTPKEKAKEKVKANDVEEQPKKRDGIFRRSFRAIRAFARTARAARVEAGRKRSKSLGAELSERSGGSDIPRTPGVIDSWKKRGASAEDCSTRRSRRLRHSKRHHTTPATTEGTVTSNESGVSSPITKRFTVRIRKRSMSLDTRAAQKLLTALAEQQKTQPQTRSLIDLGSPLVSPNSDASLGSNGENKQRAHNTSRNDIIIQVSDALDGGDDNKESRRVRSLNDLSAHTDGIHLRVPGSGGRRTRGKHQKQAQPGLLRRAFTLSRNFTRKRSSRKKKKAEEQQQQQTPIGREAHSAPDERTAPKMKFDNLFPPLGRGRSFKNRLDVSANTSSALPTPSDVDERELANACSVCCQKTLEYRDEIHLLKQELIDAKRMLFEREQKLGEQEREILKLKVTSLSLKRSVEK